METVCFQPLHIILCPGSSQYRKYWFQMRNCIVVWCQLPFKQNPQPQQEDGFIYTVELLHFYYNTCVFELSKTYAEHKNGFVKKVLLYFTSGIFCCLSVWWGSGEGGSGSKKRKNNKKQKTKNFCPQQELISNLLEQRTWESPVRSRNITL